jgi:hypothetical protein
MSTAARLRHASVGVLLTGFDESAKYGPAADDDDSCRQPYSQTSDGFSHELSKFNASHTDTKIFNTHLRMLATYIHTYIFIGKFHIMHLKPTF